MTDRTHEALDDLVLHFLPRAEQCSYMGVRITEMSRDELMCVIMACGERYLDLMNLAAHERETLK